MNQALTADWAKSENKSKSIPLKPHMLRKYLILLNAIYFYIYNIKKVGETLETKEVFKNEHIRTGAQIEYKCRAFSPAKVGENFDPSATPPSPPQKKLAPTRKRRYSKLCINNL